MSPDILLIGSGSPIQELWINRNFERLMSGVVWAIGATVALAFGKVSRG